MRGAPMNAHKQERLSPYGRLVEAAVTLADADSEDDKAYHSAENLLRRAAVNWVDDLRSRGGR